MPEDPMIYGGYTWVPEEGKDPVKCGCGGQLEFLRCEPPRSRAYLNHILMCNGCKRIYH